MHVVVVGAGVFGTAAALELRTRGHRVTIVEPGRIPADLASSTDVSKMVRMDYGSDVFYHELAEAALDGWDRWNAEWPRPLYHETGFLILAAEPMAEGGFEHESRRVLRERGYDPERLDGDTIARRFPSWAPGAYPDGYVSPRAGWVESAVVVDRLARLCRASGVEVREARVTGLVESDAGVSGVTTADGKTLAAERVLVAAGAWTPGLLPWLGNVMWATAQPVVHLSPQDPEAFRAPTFLPFAADIAGSGWYGFSATDTGRVKIARHGPGAPDDPSLPQPVADEHLEELRAFLARALPGLAGAPVTHTRTCMYCDTFDGDLWISADADREGLVVAAGGSGHGFKFAPVLGPVIADAVEGRDNRWAARLRARARGARRTEEARFDG